MVVHGLALLPPKEKVLGSNTALWWGHSGRHVLEKPDTATAETFFMVNAGQIAATFGLFLYWFSAFSSYAPFSFSFLSFPLNNDHIVE